MSLETMIFINIAVTITTMLVVGVIYKTFFVPDSVVPAGEVWVGNRYIPWETYTVLSAGDFCVGARYNHIHKYPLEVFQNKYTSQTPDDKHVEYVLQFQVKDHLKAAKAYFVAYEVKNNVSSFLSLLYAGTPAGKGTFLPEREVFLQKANDYLAALLITHGVEVTMTDYEVLTSA